MIGNAKMYLNGSELIDISSKDPKTKITIGVQQLIKVIYTNLKMLTVDFTEDHLKKIIESKDDVLFKDNLHEVETEILNKISRNRNAHERSTTKNLLEFFTARPYGWYQTAILCIIAKLYKRNKISIRQDSNALNDTEVYEALSKNNQFANTIIELEEEISNSFIQKLKSFHQEYFNEANLGNEPKDISRLFKQRITNELQDLNTMSTLRSRLEFLNALGEPISRIKLLVEKEHPYFFTSIELFQDNLLDDKEKIIDPIKKFMNGAQKDIFENILYYLESNNANFSYLEKAGIERLMLVKESKTPYLGNLMQEAKQALEQVKSELTIVLQEERGKAIGLIQGAIDKIKSFADFKKLDSKQQSEILLPLQSELIGINNERFIGNIRTRAGYAANEIYQKQLELMSLIANPSARAGDVNEKPKITYVSKDTVKVTYTKPSLETKEDVEEYIKALKEQYIKLIEENKRISL
ncbi:MAG: hypothetical protein IPO49_15370 [Bacteroidetes bacterium]|nr:hypothetical protein [Bacteroidota bacterium]